MSLQTSYERSHSVQVVDLRSVDPSMVDRGETETSSAKHLFAKDATLSLRHLDVSISITVHDSDAERSPEGTSCFKVSAERLVDCKDTGHPSADRDDTVMRQLSEALAAAEAGHNHHSAVCADALRLAILTRQFSMRIVRDRRVEKPRARNTKSLQTWRLKRVLQYVENHLTAKITLQDLAKVAGLSRMHFAAQFRTAMRLRPHDYLLKRRIECAKELLKQAEVPLVDVALTVGFQTQAHFTTVFKRLTGDTPCQWRNAYLALDAAIPPIQKRLPSLHSAVGTADERRFG